MADVITLGRFRAVMGLRWVVHERMPGWAPVRDLSRDLGQWVARRRGESIIQTGYCAPIAGETPRRLVSLAALVADARPEPWMRVFDLGHDKWWFVAVRDNNGILPEGDVVGTYEEVQEARARIESLGSSWPQDILTQADGTLEDLEALVSQGRAAYLQDAAVRPWLRPALAGGALIALSAAGMLAWRAHEADVRAKRLAATDMARLAAARVARAGMLFLPPWRQEASTEAFARACVTAWNVLPIEQDGWIPQKITCRERPWKDALLAVSKTRPLWENGTISISWRTARKAGASPLLAPPGQLLAGGRVIRQILMIRLPLAEGGLEAAQVARRMAYSHLRASGFSVHFARAAPHSGLPGAHARAPGPRTAHPWKSRSLTVSWRGPWMSGLGAVLGTVPGLRVRSLTIGPTGGVLKGVLYGRRAAQ